jgi:hypothetical protein
VPHNSATLCASSCWSPCWAPTQGWRGVAESDGRLHASTESLCSCRCAAGVASLDAELPVNCSGCDSRKRFHADGYGLIL